MHKISEIIGLQVISLFEGQVIGYIKNFVLSENNKKIIEFTVETEKEDEQILSIETKNIYRLKDALFIKNKSFIKKSTNNTDFSPMNCNAYLSDGTSLGKIIDVIFSKNFYIISYVCSNATMKNSILKLTKEIAIFNKPKSSLSILKFKPIDNSFNQTIQTVEQTNQAVPVRTVSDFNFLIGRKVSKDIYAFSNEILIRAGGTITDRIIQTARKSGKLKELAMYS